MHQMLIITSRRASPSEQGGVWEEREKYVQAFCQELQASLGDTSVLYTTYNDLEYSVRGGQTSVYDSRNNIELSAVDLVHFKNWEYNFHEAPVVAAYLKSKGIRFYNSEVLVPWAPGKLAQMVCLAEGGVPVPETFYASKSRLRERLVNGDMPDGLGYPFIMKANDGSKGNDNYLIRDAKEALEILDASDDYKEYVLQEFIPNDGDYRFLFIGLEDDPLVFHRKANGDTHLNNTSKGGTGNMVEISSLPADYLRHARQAAQLLGREIGGVDILVNKQTGNPYVLEVNGTPALATGYGVDRKLGRFANFVRRGA